VLASSELTCSALVYTVLVLMFLDLIINYSEAEPT